MVLTRAARRSLKELELEFSPTKFTSSNVANNDCSESQGRGRRERAGHRLEIRDGRDGHSGNLACRREREGHSGRSLNNGRSSNDGDENSTTTRDGRSRNLEMACRRERTGHRLGTTCRSSNELRNIRDRRS